MAAPAPLTGVRVIDLTQALAGPYCTLVLGDLGADVIKIEIPGRGDDSRHWGPPFLASSDGPEAPYFLSANRNKRSVALDLKSEGGLRAAQDLAVVSDVVVENFRPGTAERLGLGADDLRDRDPRLIYCSVSGFGQVGRTRAGYDQIVQGMSGLMSVTGEPGSTPTKVGVPIGDIAAGMFAAHAVIAVLYEREHTGRGRHIDVAMLDSTIALLTYQAARFFATGEAPSREGNRHPLIAPYATFETAAGFVNICCANDSLFRRCCEALGVDHLARDERFTTNADRLVHRDTLTELLQGVLKGLATDEVVTRLEEVGVPVGPISTIDEVFADPEVRARGLRVEVPHPTLGEVSVSRPPWWLDGQATDVLRAPPVLGQHTAEVLQEVVGYTDDDITALAKRGDIQV